MDPPLPCSPLLQYARFHGLASESAALEFLNQTSERAQKVPPETSNDLGKRPQQPQISMDEALDSEKLTIGKESVRLLSTVIQEANAKHIDIDWDEYLPSVASKDELKLEVPFFLDTSLDSVLSQRARDRRDGLDVHNLDECAGSSMDRNRVLRDDDIMESIQHDKLHCAKRSLVMIHNAVSSRRPSVEELDGLFGDVRGQSQTDQVQPLPSLLFSDVDDTLCKSPSPVPQSQMLPSPAASGSLAVSPERPRERATMRNPETTVFAAGPDDIGFGESGVRPQDGSSIHDELVDTRNIFPSPPSHDVSPHFIANDRSNTSGMDVDISTASQPSPNSGPVYDELSPMKAVQSIGSRETKAPEMNEAVINTDPPHSGVKSTMSLNTALPYRPNRSISPSVLESNSMVPTEKSTARTDGKSRSPRLKNESPQNLTTKRRKTSQGMITSSKLPSLGSLSAFMETRNRYASKPVVKSPYFFGDTEDDKLKDDDSARNNDITPIIPEEEPDSTSPIMPAQQFPQLQPKNNQENILVISTELLKTHLPLIQHLEKANEKPTMVYRDYDRNLYPRRKNAPLSENHSFVPPEADIIISPSTGILLTTSQATTQQYLPGHKPPFHGQIHGKYINSPLRERLYRLATRYERIYVLVSHAITTTATGKAACWTADERLLLSFTATTAFCNSLSAHFPSTITPIMIPCSPETVSQWVLALAQKHPFVLPHCHRSRSFTPVNRSLEPDVNNMETETLWEMFLRQAGLNPLAAQVILRAVRGSQNGGLSELLGMTAEEKRSAFQELIGRKVLRRVSTVLDKDWQCDWALNFDE